MPDLAITTQSVTAALAIMKISGAVDAANFARLEGALSTALAGPADRILVDATELEAASSAALGAIVDFSVQLANRGGKMALAAPAGELRGLLDLLGLGEVLAVAGTVDEGRKALAAK